MQSSKPSSSSSSPNPRNPAELAGAFARLRSATRAHVARGLCPFCRVAHAAPWLCPIPKQ